MLATSTFDETRVRVVLAAAAGLVLVMALLTAAFRLGQENAVSPGLPAAFDPLAEAYHTVTTGAVEVPDADTLAVGALDGMVAALEDPYAAYYEPAEYTAFNNSLAGEFTGVGIVLEEAPDGLTVVRVLVDTPAAQAGVVVGDRIVSVDGRDVRELPLPAVVGLIKGEVGTSVRLGLEGAGGQREVTATRARIHVPNVEAKLLDDGAGYVQLMQFSKGASQEVRAAVDDLVAKGARGVVLDLRGNPGGLLPEAVEVASVFLDEGPVVLVREREGVVEKLSARGDAVDLPLVVLVDEGSASASEIVAGAIQDHGRGQVVGVTTFGKGTVQTVQTLANGSGLKFTTAEYLTPSGDSIEGVGVVPDTVVQGADAQLAAAQETLRTMLAAQAR